MLRRISLVFVVCILASLVAQSQDEAELFGGFSYMRFPGANLAGWKFLTGSPDAIQSIERRYGVFAARVQSGDVDHTNLISVVDPRGMMRVQYLGVRFDPDELRRDLLSLTGKS